MCHFLTVAILGDYTHRFGYAEGTCGKPVKKPAGKFTSTGRFPVPKFPYRWGVATHAMKNP